MAWTTAASAWRLTWAASGSAREDVDIVFNGRTCTRTHAGGCTQWSDQSDPESEVVPSFPNARYLVQRLELADAGLSE